MEVKDVLVTGGSVRLGRRVVDRLRAEGLEPRAMSRSGRPGTVKRRAVVSSRISSYSELLVEQMAPSRSRSPLTFFSLILALSVLLWALGLFVEVKGLPKNMQVTEPVLAFTPLVAASILVYKEEKLAGVKELLKRLFDFKRTKHRIWYIPAVLLMPLVYLLSYVGVQVLGISLPVQPEIPFMAIPLLLVLYFIGAAGEELGYSGYVTDPTQERFGALEAGLIIGSFWAVWHVPALLQNNLSLEYIVWGLPATVGLRILIIWLYNNMGKSVFAANLCHATALVGSSSVATSACTPIIVVAAVIVTFLWGSETLARYRYAGSRQYEHA